MESNKQEEDEGMTYEEFLVYSARHGEIEDVKEMLDAKPPVNVNYQDKTMGGNTALHVACANGHDKVV